MSHNGHARDAADFRAEAAKRASERQARHAFIIKALRADSLDRQTVALRFGVSLKQATVLLREARESQMSMSVGQRRDEFGQLIGGVTR